MIKKIKKYMILKLKFKYIQACLISFLLFMISTVVMFITEEIWSSFFCSISAGFLTGFVFFVISGLKSYDINYYYEQNEIGQHCQLRTKQVCKNIEKFLSNQNTVSYGRLQGLKFDVQECYIYYSKILMPNITSNEEYKENAKVLKEVFDEFAKKVGDLNSLDESKELYDEFKPILFKLYKHLILLIPNYTLMCACAQLTMEELKHNVF